MGSKKKNAVEWFALFFIGALFLFPLMAIGNVIELPFEINEYCSLENRVYRSNYNYREDVSIYAPLANCFEQNEQDIEYCKGLSMDELGEKYPSENEVESFQDCSNSYRV